MILLDTSVLIRYLRSGSPGIREVLKSVDCAICGVTRAEILHGARTPEDAKKLNEAVDAFIELPISSETWKRLGDHLARLRRAGLPMPFQDVLIATVAIENDADLWACDAHYERMAGVVGGLKLFKGPEA